MPKLLKRGSSLFSIKTLHTILECPELEEVNSSQQFQQIESPVFQQRISVRQISLMSEITKIYQRINALSDLNHKNELRLQFIKKQNGSLTVVGPRNAFLNQEEE
ncbi:Hypothetical_protein [Hexamita inflata]|uniref:Hypothetical_protein n=1 Tax=Hexamita inflata TaxID=28002 RepID=A0AA86N9J7_9EUKA|nr:Hypothetical protein HINF_LOCUS2828 [Hexamita inflata]CAI9977109.1 Hypothetical protein HINF_LOCUS64754 [Hexamita inflata]